MRTWVALVLFLGLVGSSTSAAAKRLRVDPAITCTQNSSALDDDLSIDGRLDDWNGVAATNSGGPTDGSFTVRCLYDAKSIALAIDVRDDKVVRVRKGRASEDNVTISLGATKPLLLQLFPGTATGKPRRSLGGKAIPRWISVEDSLQAKGYSVEILIPRSRIPGTSDAAAKVDASLSVFDSDAATAAAPTPRRASGGLVFAAARDLLADFLKAVGARASSVIVDELVDFDPTHKGKERVVVVRDAGVAAVALLTDAFGYMTLPVAAGRDLIDAKLVDWRGDGSRVLAATVRETGGGGSRDMLMMIGGKSGNVGPIQIIEVRKESGANRLGSTWKIVKVGSGKRAVTELQVTATPATGWTADTFREAPAPDAAPINLPWDEARYATAFRLLGEAVETRALPMPKSRTRR